MALFKQLVESDDQLLTEAFNSKPYETTMTKKGAGDVFFTFGDEDGKEFRIQFYTSGGLGKNVRRVYVGEKQGNVYKDAIKGFKNPMRVIATMIKSTEDYLQTPLGKSIQGLAIDLSKKAAPKGVRLIKQIVKRSKVIKKHLDIIDSDLTVDPGRGVVWTVRKGVDAGAVYDGKKVAGLLGGGEEASGGDVVDTVKGDNLKGVMAGNMFESLEPLLRQSLSFYGEWTFEDEGNMILKGRFHGNGYEFRVGVNTDKLQYTFEGRLYSTITPIVEHVKTMVEPVVEPKTTAPKEFGNWTVYANGEVTHADGKIKNLVSMMYDKTKQRYGATIDNVHVYGMADIQNALARKGIRIPDEVLTAMAASDEPKLTVGQNIIDAFELDDNGEGGYEADIGDDDWLEVNGSEWSLSYASNDTPYASGSVNDSGAIDAIKRAVKGRTEDSFDSLDTPEVNRGHDSSDAQSAVDGVMAGLIDQVKEYVEINFNTKSAWSRDSSSNMFKSGEIDGYAFNITIENEGDLMWTVGLNGSKFGRSKLGSTQNFEALNIWKWFKQIKPEWADDVETMNDDVKISLGLSTLTAYHESGETIRVEIGTPELVAGSTVDIKAIKAWEFEESQPTVGTGGDTEESSPNTSEVQEQVDGDVTVDQFQLPYTPKFKTRNRNFLAGFLGSLRRIGGQQAVSTSDSTVHVVIGVQNDGTGLFYPKNLNFRGGVGDISAPRILEAILEGISGGGLTFNSRSLNRSGVMNSKDAVIKYDSSVQLSNDDQGVWTLTLVREPKAKVGNFGDMLGKPSGAGPDYESDLVDVPVGFKDGYEKYGTLKGFRNGMAVVKVREVDGGGTREFRPSDLWFEEARVDVDTGMPVTLANAKKWMTSKEIVVKDKYRWDGKFKRNEAWFTTGGGVFDLVSTVGYSVQQLARQMEENIPGFKPYADNNGMGYARYKGSVWQISKGTPKSGGVGFHFTTKDSPKSGGFILGAGKIHLDEIDWSKVKGWLDRDSVEAKVFQPDFDAQASSLESIVRYVMELDKGYYKTAAQKAALENRIVGTAANARSMIEQIRGEGWNVKELGWTTDTPAVAAVGGEWRWAIEKNGLKGFVSMVVSFNLAGSGGLSLNLLAPNGELALRSIYNPRDAEFWLKKKLKK
ncbi:hypothetical protein VPHK369_0040 [Vibrio phage K369]